MARPDVKVVILTMPDRLGGDPHEWYELGRDLASRGYGVIITCAEASARLLGVRGRPARLEWTNPSRSRPVQVEPIRAEALRG